MAACALQRRFPAEARTILQGHEEEKPDDTEKEKASHEMDRANNEVGMRLAQETGTCENLAVREYEAGHLTTIWGGRELAGTEDTTG